MAERKAFLLRIDPALHDDLQRWARDDLRSLNAQVEFILSRAVRDNNRSSNRNPESTKKPAAGTDSTD